MFIPAIRATIFTFQSALTLLMTFIGGADNAHHAVSADNFAVSAHFLN
jgi:hypothetical protein